MVDSVSKGDINRKPDETLAGPGEPSAPARAQTVFTVGGHAGPQETPYVEDFLQTIIGIHWPTKAGEVGRIWKVIFLKVGVTSWTVPQDWDNNNNRIDCIGGGGGGAGGYRAALLDTQAGSGAGGAGWAFMAHVPLTAGATIRVKVGAGGPGTVGSSRYQVPSLGGDTIFDTDFDNHVPGDHTGLYLGRVIARGSNYATAGGGSGGGQHIASNWPNHAPDAHGGSYIGGYGGEYNYGENSIAPGGGGAAGPHGPGAYSADWRNPVTYTGGPGSWGGGGGGGSDGGGYGLYQGSPYPGLTGTTGPFAGQVNIPTAAGQGGIGPTGPTGATGGVGGGGFIPGPTFTLVPDPGYPGFNKGPTGTASTPGGKGTLGSGGGGGGGGFYQRPSLFSGYISTADAVGQAAGDGADGAPLWMETADAAGNLLPLGTGETAGPGGGGGGGGGALPYQPSGKGGNGGLYGGGGGGGGGGYAAYPVGSVAPHPGGNGGKGGDGILVITYLGSDPEAAGVDPGPMPVPS